MTVEKLLMMPKDGDIKQKKRQEGQCGTNLKVVDKKSTKKKKIKEIFFAKHKGLDKFLYRVWENNFKEIARGEITEQDIVDDVKKKFDIDLPIEYVGGIK